MEQIYTEFDLSAFSSAEFTMLHKRNSQLLREGHQERCVLTGVTFPARPCLPLSRPCLPLSRPFHSAGARGTIAIQAKQNVNLLKAALLCTEMVSVSKLVQMTSSIHHHSSCGDLQCVAGVIPCGSGEHPMDAWRLETLSSRLCILTVLKYTSATIFSYQCLSLPCCLKATLIF